MEYRYGLRYVILVHEKDCTTILLHSEFREEPEQIRQEESFGDLLAQSECLRSDKPSAMGLGWQFSASLCLPGNNLDSQSTEERGFFFHISGQ